LHGPLLVVLAPGLLPGSTPVLPVPSLLWSVLAFLPGKDNVRVNVELLWGQAGAEALDEVS